MKWQVSHPQKLVLFLQGQLGQYSGKSLRKLLEANLCRINGRVERFGSRSLQSGDRVELSSAWQSALTAVKPHFDVLHEQDDFKIINKPAGWVCTDAETAKALGAQHFLVHRLDKDTTGALLIAKSIKARDQLMGLFEKREVLKRYLAIVDGIVQELSGIRKSMLAKKGSFQGQTIWGSSIKGLTAITRWELLQRGKQASLVQCLPETGRTHQIRVHMAEMGHPILIDRQYAHTFRSSLFVRRPLLHASQLSFSFQAQLIDVSAPLPDDMREVLALM